MTAEECAAIGLPLAPRQPRERSERAECDLCQESRPVAELEPRAEMFVTPKGGQRRPFCWCTKCRAKGGRR
jgi:hypothetical protein